MGVSCLAPPLRSGAKQLGPSSLSRAHVVQPEPAWCLRYAPDTNLAFAYSGTASHSAVLGVELEQMWQRTSCIQISQRIGSAANPGGRADENRKLRGFAAHLLRR
jgi:hypothetical protein